MGERNLFILDGLSINGEQSFSACSIGNCITIILNGGLFWNLKPKDRKLWV